ncbi:MAG TPA: DMT family transporter [Terriglobales bacterium]|nr:DMT family transporter [Terriglobales bacterium]
MPARHPLRGYLYIAGATFFWGISASLGRAVFTGRLFPSAQAWPPIDPLILAQSRTTFSLIVLAPILFARRGRELFSLPKIDVWRCLLLGTLGVAASNYFYYLAIQKTNVATAIIIQYTAPVWVLLYMVARRLQAPTAQRIFSVGLAVVGSALAIGIVGHGGLRFSTLGIAAAMLAAFSFAFYNVYGHGILLRYDRWKILVFTLGGAVLCWLIINPPWKIAAAHYAPAQWAFLVVFAVTSVLIPFSFYFSGLQHLDATRAIVTSCLEPVFSILIAAIALGEIVKPLQALGIAIVLTATVLVQLPGKQREQASLLEPIE